jgi:DNA-binding NtrC family response regulator
MNAYRILLLDDDDFVLAALRRELLRKPYIGHAELEIETFTSPFAALARAQEYDGYFDVAISDIRMPEMNGIDFLKAFGHIHPDAASIILSGHADMPELVRAINEAHIDFFIVKPWTEYDLKKALLEAIRHYDIRHENRLLADQYFERFGLHHQFRRKDIYHLMVVDDDPHVLRALERELCQSCPSRGAFGPYRLELDTFEHADAALQAARERQFDVVIVDYVMREMDGIEFLRRIREVRPDAVRMLISGVADVEVLIAAVNTGGVSHFIGKPWHDYELRAAIDLALSHHELELENRFLTDLLLLKDQH